MTSTWRASALRTRTTVVVAILVTIAIVIVAVVASLRGPFDPAMLGMRIVLGVAVCLAMGVLVSRMVTRPIQAMMPSLQHDTDPAIAAARVRAAAYGAPREVVVLAEAIASLLDHAAARATALHEQQLQLLDTNIALNEERRQMLRLERQRAASDLLLDAVVQVLPDALVVVDAQLRIRVWSGVAASLFQVDSAQALGVDFISTCIAAPHRDEARQAWGRRKTSRFEIDAIRGDGSEFPIELTLTPVSTPRGKHFAISVRDLVVARQIETEARQAQKLEAVGRLASGVAHEINTPIQFIGDSMVFARDGSADLLELIEQYRDVVRTCAPADAQAQLATAEETADLAYLTEELPNSFGRTLDGVQRVATIIRAMKEFAHPESSHKSMTDLNRAIASTLTVARNEVKYAAEVETDFGELPMIACHVGELNQVFLNLLINAAHAIQDSGKHPNGTLGKIRVVTRADASEITISISDNGCGIPDTVRGKVYDPFFTTKTVGRGTGQGLAIARNVIIDKHRGSISFDSQVGVGTTFQVRLPLQ